MKNFSFGVKSDYKHAYMALKDFGLSESLISFLRKKAGRLLRNGQIIDMSSSLKSGDQITISLEDDTSTELPISNLKLDILFENDCFLAVNKPAGISCIPSKSHYNENLACAVCEYMKNRQPNFVYRVLGRLDKDTSGVVVIARDRLSAENASVTKTYHAICQGDFPFDNLEINLPICTITKDGINRQKRQVLSQQQKANLLEKGFSVEEKPALTFVKKLKNLANCTLLEITLQTGRTHQIRVHMAALGFPLLNDPLYSTGSSRALLHCKSATICLPILGFKKKISAPLPADFKAQLKTELPKFK